LAQPENPPHRRVFIGGSMAAVIILALMTAIALAATLVACYSDLMSLRIPNRCSIAIVAAFVLAFAAAPESFEGWRSHLAALAGFFLITYIMFVTGMIGGGDAKLGSALALWVGLKGLATYVFCMALVGGVIACLSLFIKRKKPFRSPPAKSWMAQAQEGRNAVPYGIAISIGAWVALFQSGFLSHEIDEVFKIIH
jgi:prepilin peptidase CpaA